MLCGPTLQDEQEQKLQATRPHAVSTFRGRQEREEERPQVNAYRAVDRSEYSLALLQESSARASKAVAFLDR